MKSTTHFYTIKRDTHRIDAAGQLVGRLSSTATRLLLGKHKATYTPQVDNGDFVVIDNASAVRFSGKKFDSKEYYHYSGYPGGMKVKKASELKTTNPSELLIEAISRMLPRSKHRADILKRLIVKN